MLNTFNSFPLTTSTNRCSQSEITFDNKNKHRMHAGQRSMCLGLHSIRALKTGKFSALPRTQDGFANTAGGSISIQEIQINKHYIYHYLQ